MREMSENRENCEIAVPEAPGFLVILITEKLVRLNKKSPPNVYGKFHDTMTTTKPLLDGQCLSENKDNDGGDFLFSWKSGDK